MRDWCSCRRTAYQAIHKRQLEGDSVVHDCERHYSHLGEHYLADAVFEAGRVQNEHAIFGGKRNWQKLQQGELTKEQWQRLRNNALFSG